MLDPRNIFVFPVDGKFLPADSFWEVKSDKYLCLVIRSTDTLAKGGEVKFDIWEEADMELGEEENKEENSICDHNLESGAAADTVDGGGEDHDDSFHYAQHPLVVSSAASTCISA